MIVPFLAWVMAAAPPAAIVSIRAEDPNGRTVIEIVAAALPLLDVRREKDRLFVRFESEPAGGLTVPPPATPIRALRVVEAEGSVALEVDLDPDVAHAIDRKDGVLSIVLTRRAEGIGLPPAEDLYGLLFPSPADRPTAEVAIQEGGPGEATAAGAIGIPFGPFNLRPALTAGYVDADIVVGDASESRHDAYFEIQPRIAVESVASWLAHLTVEYKPRFRAGSDYEITRRPTHLADAAIDWPATSRLETHVKGHYAHGTLETDEVDPGREYYYRLGRFTHDEVSASAQFEAAPRFGIDVGAGLGRVRFEEESSFFEYDRRFAHAALYYESSPRTRLSLGYHLSLTPTVDARPEAESTEHSGRFRIDGDLGPLVKGFMSFGYAQRENSKAPADGRRYRGLVASMGVSKSFTPASVIRLTANRATYLSAFENNGFYVSTSGMAELSLPIPWAFALRGGTGYHVNEYPTPASETGVPRRDRLFGWSIGLGRAIGRAAYLRADYRWDRRDSNVNGFDHDTQALLIQLGAGYFSLPEY
ncbi:MAG: outer membrane beta-barrel protein [Vicinamibacteria bacterium]|nr:outer membrane beta-barrel protein [Vicinamibacteria bacterium]